MKRILILTTDLLHMQHMKDMMHTHNLVFAQTMDAAQKLIDDGGWDVIAFRGQLETAKTDTLELVANAKEKSPNAILIANDPVWNSQLMKAGCTIENRDRDYLHLIINRL